jgi:hypothetical protein
LLGAQIIAEQSVERLAVTAGNGDQNSIAGQHNVAIAAPVTLPEEGIPMIAFDLGKCALREEDALRSIAAWFAFTVLDEGADHIVTDAALLHALAEVLAVD